MEKGTFALTTSSGFLRGGRKERGRREEGRGGREEGERKERGGREEGERRERGGNFTKPVQGNEVAFSPPTHLAVVSLSSVVTKEMTPVLIPMENTPVGG